MTRLVLAAALAVCLAPTALAQTCTRTWAAPVDGSWSVAANWTPAEVPTAGDVACITAAGTYTVSIGGFVTVAAETLVLGGASGTQTLTSQGYVGIGSATVGPNGRFQFVNITPGGDDGLYLTGTITVEGEVSVPGGVTFLRNSGTLDVAPSGTLRLSDQARVGGIQALFRVRGTVEGVGCPFPINTGQCTIQAPVEVLGGTLRAASGVLQLQAGGTMDGATLDAGPESALILNADLIEPYQMTVEGLIQGAPQGTVGMAGLNLYAGPAGATLAVTGTGFQMVGTSILRSGGGAFTNTGLLLKAATGSNFSGLAEGTLRNEGVIEIPSSLALYAGGVLRNEPGGVVRASAGGSLAGDGNGTGRFENAGLFVLDAPDQSFSFGDGGFGNNSGPYSESGSELRVLAGTLDLPGPASTNLPEGTTLTGTGAVGTAISFEPEGEISPGTDSRPLAALGVASYFRPSLTAGDPRLVIDIDGGGRSDTLAVSFAPGSQNTRLGGTLVVRVRPGYAPAVGDRFTILTSGSAIEGEFAAVVAEHAGGAEFMAETAADGLSVVLTVTQSVADESLPDALAFGVAALSSPSAAPALRVTLAESADLRVEVYDVRGRRVVRLAEGARAPGTHVLTTSDLAPGLYLARIAATGPTRVEQATQRFVVVR